MRPGISRVVVEIIILVIAVALALLIFSPISGYIFGSLGRTSTVGGAAQIQILNVEFPSGGGIKVDVKNLGPGTIPPGEWRVYVNGTYWGAQSTNDALEKDKTITIQPTDSNTYTVDTTKQHSIVIYGPGNTQAQYLYYPKG
jgi:hypothetical protein